MMLNRATFLPFRQRLMKGLDFVTIHDENNNRVHIHLTISFDMTYRQRSSVVLDEASNTLARMPKSINSTRAKPVRVGKQALNEFTDEDDEPLARDLLE
eukprot:1140429-Pelagomonas_calceolata.AAC.2